jgi:hypothetical protein
MTTLTGRNIDDTYKDLLHVENGGTGIDATLADVEDGAGNATPLQVSTTTVNIDGTFTVQGSEVQPLDSDLTAIAAVSSNGLLTRTGSGTYAARTVSAASNKLTVTNGDGVSGNLTLDLVEANCSLSNIGGTLGLSQLTALTASRAVVSNGSGQLAAATTTATEIGYVNGVTSAIQTQIDGKQPIDSDLTALAAISTNGLLAHTASGTAAARTLTAGSSKLTITNGDGVSGNPTLDVDQSVLTIAQSQVTNLVTDLSNKQPLDSDLTAVAALATTGLISRTGTGTAATRTLTAPAAGITVTNGDGVAGNPTLVLANDLSALEGLGSTGIAVRSASDTWVQRTITASAGITVTNGDGVSGNPALTVDINGLTADASPDSAADYVMTYDASASANKKVLLTNLPGGGGGGAPTGAQYVTLATDGTLTSERVLTAGSNITITDAGAGSTVTVSAQGANALINGNFDIWQRGTSITSSGNYINSDDRYVVDRWNLLSEANNTVNVSQETSIIPDGSIYSCKSTVQTANKKWGFLQILEAKDSKKLTNKNVSLSFQARTTSGQIRHLRAAVLSWSSTADSVTSDVVSVWGAEGTNPTWASNWTAENTATDLSITNSFATYTIENIAVDTASMANVAVFIWVDDADGASSDVLYLSQVKLEVGTKATGYRYENIQDTFGKCSRYFTLWGEHSFGRWASSSSVEMMQAYQYEMRTTATISLYSTTPQLIEWGIGTRNGTATAITFSSAGNKGADVTFNGFSGATSGNLAFSRQDIAYCDAEL